MSISIRLKKMGKKGQPFYRVVVADTLKKHEGTYIENLGWYDPLVKGENYLINQDRIDYWLARGARISDTVNSLVRKNRKRKPAEVAAPAQ
ncbi:MAG TPA: 30S ribosomal protein S16 [Kiritimatiellia bacterium]|nr:30S ribosomal protein S16 [Kiritimatiellia bacterium]